MNIFKNKASINFSNVAIISAFAVACRIALIFYIGASHLSFGDEKSYWEIGKSILFGTGFSLNGVPTSALSPIFSIFAAITSLFWHNPVSTKLVQAILSVVNVWLVYAIAKYFCDNRWALVAAILYAFSVPQIYLTSVLYPQFLGSIWVLILFFVFLKYRNRNLSSFGAALFGAFIAFGALLIPMLLILAILPSLELNKGYKNWLAAILGFIIVLTPWVARNTITIGKPIIFTSTGWLNFWAGNSEYTTASSGSYPVYRTDEGKEIISLGEFKSVVEFRKQAFEYIGKHPLRVLTMYPLKFLNFWRFYPKPVTKTKISSTNFKIIYAIFWLPVLVMSMLYFVVRRKDKSIRVIFFSIFLFALGYSIFFTRVRFRMPIEPMLLIFAVAFFNIKKVAQKYSHSVDIIP